MRTRNWFFSFPQRLPNSKRTWLFRCLLHLRKHYPATGFLRNVVDVDVADDSLLVDDEDRPFREAFFPLDAVFTRHLSQGAEIAQQRKRDAAQTFCPCLEAGDVINTDAQDLGI